MDGSTFPAQYMENDNNSGGQSPSSTVIAVQFTELTAVNGNRNSSNNGVNGGRQQQHMVIALMTHTTGKAVKLYKAAG